MRFHPSKFRLGDGVSLAGRAMRVAGVVVLAPQMSPTMTRAILAPPTDDGSIGLA